MRYGPARRLHDYLLGDGAESYGADIEHGHLWADSNDAGDYRSGQWCEWDRDKRIHSRHSACRDVDGDDQETGWKHSGMHWLSNYDGDGRYCYIGRTDMEQCGGKVMRRLLLLALLIAPALWAQQTQVASDTLQHAACASSCGSGGQLGANWKQNSGNNLLESASGVTQGFTGNGYDYRDQAYWAGTGSFGNDMYSQVNNMTR